MSRIVLLSAFAFALIGTARAEDEMQALMRSLASACTQFSEDRQWSEADACRRAWFTEHEEAVWRLQLNPHAPTSAPPS